MKKWWGVVKSENKQMDACLAWRLFRFASESVQEFSAYLLVHGVSGESDSARRYPERHAHTDAPLTVAWLNPGQPMHCPSVPDLNWPTGQAEEDRRGKQMKQIIPSYDSGHDLKIQTNINTHCVPDRPGSNWIGKHFCVFLSGYRGARWLQIDRQNHVMRAIIWRQLQ